METKKKLNLKVTVDKRHIVSIGERLYAESVELLRELVNNAYDADATEVHVGIKPRKDCCQRQRLWDGFGRPEAVFRDWIR
jgi:hypothetical protein